jgi:hypothetical protein
MKAFEELPLKEQALVLMIELIGRDITPLPKLRIERRDWGWFNRNLGINHSEHPLFKSAMGLVKELLREKLKE